MAILSKAEFNKKNKSASKDSNILNKNEFLKATKGIKTYSNDNNVNNINKEINLKNVKNTNSKYFNKGNFKDGYDFGDITKTILGTVGDIGVNAVKGVASIGENTGKLMVGGVAQVADWIGQDKYAEKIRNRLAGKDEETNKRIEKYTPTGLLSKTDKLIDNNSVLGEKSDSIVQGIGNYAGMLAAQSVGVPWQVTAGVSSAGDELSNAYANNAKDWEAWLSSGISAGVEIGSEYLSGGLKLPGTGKTAEKLIGGITEKIRKKGLKYLLESAIQFGGEGVEENISGIGSAIGKKLTYMSDKKLKELYSSDQALEDFIAGTAVSVISAGANSKTYNDVKTGKSLITGNTPEEAKQNQTNASIKDNTQQINTQNNTNIPVQQKTNKTGILEEMPKNNTKILDEFNQTKSKVSEIKDEFVQKVVNKGHYIDKIAKETGNTALRDKYDRWLGSNTEGQYVVGEVNKTKKEITFKGGQTDNNSKIIGKSISEIWNPVEEAELTKEFSEYLLHKHNIDRAKKGKNIFGEDYTSEKSKEIATNFEKQHPKFKEWAKDINTFNKNELNNLKEAGFINQEFEDYLSETYENYVKVLRNVESSPIINQYNKNLKAGTPIKKAIFGSANILPLKDTMAQQVIKNKEMIRRNEIGKELIRMYKNELEKTDTTDTENYLLNDNKGTYFITFIDGEAVKVPIDKGMYESLKPKYSKDLQSKLLKPLQKATQFQRGVLTEYSPFFTIRNFAKDFQDGMFNSKYASKFIPNYGKAIVEIIKNGKYLQQYQASGGMSNTYFDYEMGVHKPVKGVRKFLNKISALNQVIETAPRLAEFISTIEDGKSINEAMYNAAEVTTNFKRGGDYAKIANRNGATFLNASIQGLDKFYRNISGQKGIKGYTNLLLKAATLGILPAILNHLLLKDDEDYEKLSQTEKDLYYLFKVGDNKFIRIPKGRVLSIFSSATRRFMEVGENKEDAFKGLLETNFNQMAPNNPLEDNVLAPLLQASKNKTWYGGDIVSTRLQNELPKNQWDESTDELSKWVGKALNISPKKLNYVIDQYSGVIGDMLLPLSTPQAETNPLLSSFSTNSTMKNKNVSYFFETADKLQAIANDSEATEEDKVKSKYMNSIRTEVNDLYKEKREIQMSDKTDKEKTKLVQMVQEEINAILEDGLNTYKDIEIQSNYSRVGDKSYYKNSKDEWEKVDEDEEQEINNFNFNSNEYYKTKKNISEISKKYKTSDSDSEAIKKQKNSNKKGSVINQLLNSNFTDEQKNYIYSKHYSDASEVVLAKIPYNLYLKLENSIKNIKSVDDPKSNIEGKIISGSKKKQVVTAIQNLSTTRKNKLILYAMQGYSLSNSEKTEIFNYINNLKLTAKNKKNILEEMSSFQFLENGNLKGW